MKMSGNCTVIFRANCPFLRHPLYHAGYTGKSGLDTMYYCKLKKQCIRDIKFCKLSGKPEEQRETYLMRKP
jgi:hypothetical protein